VLITPNDFLVINGGRQKTSEKVIARNNMLLRTGPKQQSNNERFKERLQWVFLEYQGNISYDDSMMLVTIDILSRDDIKLNHFPASADYVLPVFYSVSFFLCIIEIVLNFSSLNIFSLGIFQTKGYIFIFFYVWSIVSVVLDLKWLSPELGLT